jgi:hypothetical protein
MYKARISIILLAFLVWLSLTGFRPFTQQPINPLPISSLLFPSSFASAPSPFGKQLPIDGAVDQPTSNLTLQWEASSPNVTYQYCLRTNKSKCPPAKWISVGANTSATLQGLTSNTRYYWQVRAVDASNNYSYADSDTWWQFTTIQNPLLPGPFNKQTPEDAQTDVPVTSLALTWSASDLATSYQYCNDIVNNNTCDTSWTSVNGLSAIVSGLSYDTTYYWQVRAMNASGIVQADFGTWFSFHTQLAPPGAFGKTSPVNSAVEQPLNLTLSWGASAGTGITYEYCISTASCTDTSTWIPAGTNLSANPGSIQYNTDYYWQVRAVNTTAITYANIGFSWSFTTIASAPSSFTKISPLDGTVDQPLIAWLYWWTPISPENTYQYCIDTAIDCPGGIWTDTPENATIQVTTPLLHNTIYFWQVRANSGGDTSYANDAWWSFTTLLDPPTSSDQSFSTYENTPFTETLVAVSNYATKNFALYGSPPAGTLDFHSDGSFTYTPVAYFNGTITFQFVVSDAHNAPVGPYTVTITIKPHQRIYMPVIFR